MDKNSRADYVEASGAMRRVAQTSSGKRCIISVSKHVSTSEQSLIKMNFKHFKNADLCLGERKIVRKCHQRVSRAGRTQGREGTRRIAWNGRRYRRFGPSRES